MKHLHQNHREKRLRVQLFTRYKISNKQTNKHVSPRVMHIYLSLTNVHIYFLGLCIYAYLLGLLYWISSMSFDIGPSCCVIKITMNTDDHYTLILRVRWRDVFQIQVRPCRLITMHHFKPVTFAPYGTEHRSLQKAGSFTSQNLLAKFAKNKT